VPTANDLITRAFRKGRVIGKDEVPAPDEAADALVDLNDMLDEWWIDKLAVFHINVEQFALVAGQQSYTMGAGGNFNTTRPVKVVPGSKYTLSNVDRQLTGAHRPQELGRDPVQGAAGAAAGALRTTRAIRSRRCTSTRRRTRRTRSTSIRGRGCRTSPRSSRRSRCRLATTG
jgi:hypothetical protein